MTPFLVLALPRSRTAWLARFLTYGPWTCSHEQARYVRDLTDMRAWFSQPYVGSSETAVARWWRLIQRVRSDVRIAIVRRPVSEVIDSLVRLEPRIGYTFDRERLTVELQRQDRALDKIDRRMPSLTVRYGDLDTEAGCRSVLEYCLQMPMERLWWQMMAPINVQSDMKAMMRYGTAFRPQLEATGQRFLKALRPRRARELKRLDNGVVIQQEPFTSFWAEGEALFAEHCVEVGEPEDQYLRKNVAMARRLDEAGNLHIVTARLNGRLLGYLSSVISQSMEHSEPFLVAAQIPFFVTADAKGLGLQLALQRASIRSLYEERGVREVYMRAGIRGAGPKLPILYKRLGAEEFGSLYKLDLNRDRVAAET